MPKRTQWRCIRSAPGRNTHTTDHGGRDNPPSTTPDPPMTRIAVIEDDQPTSNQLAGWIAVRAAAS